MLNLYYSSCHIVEIKIKVVDLQCDFVINNSFMRIIYNLITMKQICEYFHKTLSLVAMQRTDVVTICNGAFRPSVGQSVRDVSVTL